MTPEKQAELRAEQHRIHAAERARREELAQQRAAAAAAAEREKEARLAELRANARYRDIVVITLQGGAFEWNNRRFPLQPQAFELIRGERRRIDLLGFDNVQNPPQSYRETWWASFSEDGHTVSLSDGRIGPALQVVNSGGWENGSTTALLSMGRTHINRLSLAGMVATIRYKPLPGMPGRLILEQR